MGGCGPVTGLAVALGATVGLGLVLVVSGWTSPTPPRTDRHRQLWVSSAAVVGAAGLAWVVTGWPALAVAAALGAAAAPSLWRHRRQGRLHHVQRLEAIATWIEMVRDRLAGGGWFQSTIVATARLAPELIRPELTRFAAALAAPDSSPEVIDAALARLAAELGDANGDRVVMALAMWAQGHGTNLRELLSTLARQARSEAADQRDVDASRTMLRRERLIMTIVLVAVPVAMSVVDPGYLAPFGTSTGQVVLSGIVLLYGGGLLMLARLGRPVTPPRVLDTTQVFRR